MRLNLDVLPCFDLLFGSAFLINAAVLKCVKEQVGDVMKGFDNPDIEQNGNGNLVLVPQNGVRQVDTGLKATDVFVACGVKMSEYEGPSGGKVAESRGIKKGGYSDIYPSSSEAGSSAS